MSLEAEFIEIVSNSIIARVLPVIVAARLPHWWLAGGAVRNTVWKHLFGDECNLRINDFDVAFFDADGDRQQELDAKQIMETNFPGYKFDVKNQASFAVWRPGRRTFSSCEDGVGSWLHTATAVGVRIEDNGEHAIFAPYGLSDLFEGIVRPTPEHVDGQAARDKGQTFLASCPRLRLAPTNV
ncbi:MAG TPA: nucleotidyltransferase family protein [Planktothrix sp.]|jgi:hypothetical protein